MIKTIIFHSLKQAYLAVYQGVDNPISLITDKVTFLDPDEIRRELSADISANQKIALFFGWPQNSVVDIKTGILFAFNLLLMPFKFLRNLVKLVTEFTFYFLSEFFDRLNEALKSREAHYSSKSLGGALLFLGRKLSQGVSWAATIIYVFGTLCTSPMRFPKQWWKSDSKIHKAIAITAAIASAVLWAALLPVICYYVIPVLLPYAPAAVAVFYSKLVAAYHALASLLTPILPTIGLALNHLTNVVTFGLLDFLGVSLTAAGVSLANIGLSGLLSMTVLAIGCASTAIYEKVRAWCYPPKEINLPFSLEVDFIPEFGEFNRRPLVVNNGHSCNFFAKLNCFSSCKNDRSESTHSIGVQKIAGKPNKNIQIFVETGELLDDAPKAGCCW